MSSYNKDLTVFVLFDFDKKFFDLFSFANSENALKQCQLELKVNSLSCTFYILASSKIFPKTTTLLNYIKIKKAHMPNLQIHFNDQKNNAEIGRIHQ